ncbi:hypothetical protein ACFW04_003712 [Cataglyphis niger]
MLYIFKIFIKNIFYRFLASGDSMTSMSYQYLLGLTTVSNIISETCDALWSVFSKDVLPYPFTKEKWLNISEEFENLWNPEFYFKEDSMPYMLIDEAFPLTKYLMRPFSRKQNLNQEKIIHNYRLSRVRRTIENTFFILLSQWRILRKTIKCSVETAIKIVQAIVCLHNYI